MEVLMWLLWIACAEVPVDTGAEALQNVISGEVVLAIGGEAADTFVLLSDAEDPPPPYGTGGLLNFTGIPASAWSGAGLGMQAAAYAFPNVPDGSYLLTALADMDGDFSPQLDITAGATCGDVVGAHIAGLTATTPAPVVVAGGEWRHDVPVVLATQLITERPVFSLEAETVPRSALAIGYPVTLSSDEVQTDTLSLGPPLDLSAPQACSTYFPIEVIDGDGDGLPDPDPLYGELGAVNLWPQIYLSYLGETESGESWAARGLILTEPLGGAALPVNTVFPATQLSFLWMPVAQHTLSDGSTEIVDASTLPAGSWGITVISLTGQTWTVPNTLNPTVLTLQ
jgi:hypothetical protein